MLFLQVGSEALSEETSEEDVFDLLVDSPRPVSISFLRAPLAHRAQALNDALTRALLDASALRDELALEAQRRASADDARAAAELDLVKALDRARALDEQVLFIIIIFF